MKLILLGTSGYHPSDRRHTACLLLPEVGVMLDAGTAVYRAARFLETDSLDIFLTHAHLDHVVGLTYLFSVMAEHPLTRVTVHGEAEKLSAIDEHLFSEHIFPARPPMAWQPLVGDARLAGGGRLQSFPLVHQGGSRGFRLDWPGRSMAYVTDTIADPRADYVERLRGVDLLVHECYFPDGKAQWATQVGHSHTTTVAEVARAAGVGRLLLTHIDPLDAGDDPIGLATARAIFPKTNIAADLMEVEF
jgi:ribonuclease Z